MVNITGEFEFDNHTSVSLIGDKDIGFHGFVSIHRGGIQIPAFGATRIWKYSDDFDALRDSLRLSKLMTYKLLLANYSYGGAKVIIVMDKPVDKQQFLSAYAKIINSFRGGIITGADVGVGQEDLVTLSMQ